MPDMVTALGRAYLRHFPWENGKWRIAKLLSDRVCLKPTSIVATVAPNLTMELDLSDFLQRTLWLERKYEPELQSILMEYLAPGGVFVDIGANVGFFTLLASRLVGNTGHVYAFEPAPRTFAALNRNIQLNQIQNVTPMQLGLSDAQGEAAFYPDPGGNSGAGSLRPHPNNTAAITVDLDSYDRLAAEMKLPVPSLIKIDVEGAEHKVVQGMSALLSQQHRPPILMEISEFSLEKQGSSRTSLLSLMRKFGYEARVATKVRQSVLSDSGIYFQFDALFVPAGRA